MTTPHEFSTVFGNLFESFSRLWEAPSASEASEPRFAPGAERDLRPIDSSLNQQLLAAAEYDDTEANIQKLFDQNRPNIPDINASHEIRKGDTPFIIAAVLGKISMVRFLASKGANIEAKGFQGKPALAYVAGRDNTEMAAELLSMGADINSTDRNGTTTLMYAATLGKARMVAMLLDKGADVNAKDRLDFTAYSHSSNADIDLILLRAGAFATKKHELFISLIPILESNPTYDPKPALEKYKNEVAPLFKAAKENDISSIKRLVTEHKIFVDARETDDGMTSMMVAALNEQVEAITVLHSLRANIDARNPKGFTPIMFASAHGKTKAIRELHRLSADVNAKDNNGATAIMHAASKGHAMAILVLEGLGAEINDKTKKNNTALLMGVSKNHPEVVSILLSKGANPNEPDCFKRAEELLKEYADEKGNAPQEQYQNALAIQKMLIAYDQAKNSK